MNFNISKLDNDLTARTNPESAIQRAKHIQSYGVKTVIELCCGPSLKVLESAYNQLNIECYGNDIEKRWKEYYPQGKWIIDDCLKVDVSNFDCLVFAPPVTKGCTGRRIDSLQVDQVYPKYEDFIQTYKDFSGLKVLVLPARSICSRFDKQQLYRLLNLVSGYELKILTDGRRNIRKYVDIYYI